ncbi:MAG: hypothetical protein ACRDV1_03960 [Actinomycetes bacterium]
MATHGGTLALAMAGALLAACQGTDGRPASSPATGTRPVTTAAAGQCSAGDIGRVDAGSVLVPGPGNGLSRSTATGDGLTIVGVVLDPSCRPAADATVDVWHTDARGAYGPADDECCYFQGTVRTDQNGRFRLDTTKPGRYPGTNAPPAHIHLEVRHRSAALMTEIVFAGDPGVPATARTGTVPVALREAGGGPPSWYGEATLVLQP